MLKKSSKSQHLINAADADLGIPYLAGKYRLDRGLLENHQLHLSVAIIRPSLVYAPEGLGTVGFLHMARLPWLALSNKGGIATQHLLFFLKAIRKTVMIRRFQLILPNLFLS